MINSLSLKWLFPLVFIPRITSLSDPEDYSIPKSEDNNDNNGLKYFIRNFGIVFDPQELLTWKFMIPAVLLLSPLWFLLIIFKVLNNKTMSNLNMKYNGTNLGKAIEGYSRGQYRLALKFFIASIDEDLSNHYEIGEIYYKMAVCSNCLNELGSCLKYCDRTLFYNQDHIDAIRLKAQTLTKINKFEEAYYVYQILYIKLPNMENLRLFFEARSRLTDHHGDHNNGDHNNGDHNNGDHNNGDDSEGKDNDNSDSEPSFTTKTVEESYQILGLRIGANDSEIRCAYRRKLLENHPDKHPNANDAQRKLLNDKTRDISDAYKVLISN